MPSNNSIVMGEEALERIRDWANSKFAPADETGHSLSVSGTTVTLKNKAGTVLSTVTTQDTTYSAIASSTIDNIFV